MLVNQIDRLARLACHMDQHAIAGEGSVKRREGPCHRGLTVLFQRAIEVTRPVQIGVGRGQTFDADTLKRQIV